jgi:hypothetical protein
MTGHSCTCLWCITQQQIATSEYYAIHAAQVHASIFQDCPAPQTLVSHSRLESPAGDLPSQVKSARVRYAILAAAVCTIRIMSCCAVSLHVYRVQSQLSTSVDCDLPFNLSSVLNRVVATYQVVLITKHCYHELS